LKAFTLGMKYTKLRELIDKKDLDLGKLSTVHT
jgi:hypothetical protein